MTDTAARAFIRYQLGVYELLGITTTTAKQRERMAALNVVPAERKHEAMRMLSMAAQFYGRVPHGQMRVMNIHSGEIVQRTAASRVRA